MEKIIALLTSPSKTDLNRVVTHKTIPQLIAIIIIIIYEA